MICPSARVPVARGDYIPRRSRPRHELAASDDDGRFGSRGRLMPMRPCSELVPAAAIMVRTAQLYMLSMRWTCVCFDAGSFWSIQTASTQRKSYPRSVATTSESPMTRGSVPIGPSRPLLGGATCTPPQT